ncbi:MAG: MiaB/RimO family radical SAM methylthiotransferase [Actinobacteria bacterium]|nr:MiaB/RimO family radical SAM methylthiotransferase [Actinomycetota bacterium]
MAKVAVFTLGCKVNQAESEELRLLLAEAGHEVVEDPALADLCVVNTCTVTAESDRKSRKLLRRLWREGAERIVAAGCYAEIEPETVGRSPGVVAVLPNARKRGWAEEIIALLPPAGDAGVGRTRPTRRTRGFVKVQDGCERGCSYCIVPRARGEEVSVPPRSVVEMVARWRVRGCEEVVLCGVNLGRYGHGPGYDLASLVREVLGSGEGFRLRLSSLELEDLRPRWVREWSAMPRLCPHLHLPLQSGDEGILRDMGRGYTPEDFLEAAGEMRRAWPALAITTEVMVGYPGEGEAAFENTVRTLERLRPARVHVFRFSPRPGTKAWDRGDAVEPAEAERRSAALRALAERWRCSYVEERRGQGRGLLVERITCGRDGRTAWGTTEDYIKGALREPPPEAEAGKIIPVEIAGLWKGVALMRPLPREDGSV